MRNASWLRFGSASGRLGSDMSTNLAATERSAQRVIPETRPAMAKADLKKVEMCDLRPEIGSSIRLARKSLDWTLKDLAREIVASTGKKEQDEAQLQRWEAGSERPQFDILFAVIAMRGPLVIALANLASDIQIETVITVRRSA